VIIRVIRGKKTKRKKSVTIRVIRGKKLKEKIRDYLCNPWLKHKEKSVIICAIRGKNHDRLLLLF
jgi:hypothetical protein